LSEQKRAAYEAFQPVFWRKATESRAAQTPYFEELIRRDNILALVHETDGAIDAFVIAALVPAPSVYDPGGLTCMIDDFCVCEASDWEAAGRALLNRVAALAVERGAAQAVVVCGHLDQPKRAMLAAAGFGIASEWYVKPIGAPAV
jgi:GNAT superfamily N-acetyltransferase